MLWLLRIFLSSSRNESRSPHSRTTPRRRSGRCVSAFALSGGKKGAITGIAVAVGIAAFYIVVQRSFEAMGNLGQLPPALAAWSPDLIFTWIGGYLILKVPT
jgi:Lipopolysaccharide export system permease LptF/LptG